LAISSSQTQDNNRSTRDAPSPPLDVASLTHGMVRGDETAYRDFYDAYFDRLLRYLLVVTHGDEQTARDVLQAVMVRVVRHIKVFREEQQFWNWLATLARTALVDHRRKGRRYFSFLDRFTHHANVEQSAPNDNHIDEKLRELLDGGIATLDDEEQKLVQAKYVSGRSVRDIAMEWQTTEKSIESRLSRIRRKLKECVLSRLNDEQ
jgi:RNA polymerase sigma-70 factor (ECF subfamily)